MTEVALFCAAGCVLAIAWVFLWYACFGGLKRGLSVSNLVEAFLCLPCMWADTFTALKLRGFVRAWFYVLLLIAIPIAWNATFSIMDPIYSPVQLWYQVERCVLRAPTPTGRPWTAASSSCGASRSSRSPSSCTPA